KKDCGILFVKLPVLSRFVVVTEDIDGLLESIVSRFEDVSAAGRGARPVFFVGDLGQRLGHLMAFRRALFADLITDAPENDAGMIAVAANQGTKILFMPVVEE